MGLRYATITGVTRDDLPDGAAWLYAETTRQIRAKSPGTGIELLVDDFRGSNEAIDMVIEAAPQVFAHNLETVPRIFKKIRPAFRYERSLAMIQRAHDGGIFSRSRSICAPLPCITRSTVGCTQKNSSSFLPKLRQWALPESWQAHSCARRTVLACCGQRECAPEALRSPHI